MAALVSSVVSNVPLGVNFQLMKGLLSAARQKLPYFNGTLPGELIENGSTASVKWERLENLAASTTALGEIVGTAAAFYGRNAVQNTVTTVSTAVSKFGNAVILTEEIDFQQMNLRAARFVDSLGANAGLSLNLLMAAAFSSGVLAANTRFTTGLAGSTVSTDAAISSPITLTDIKFCTNGLNRNSAMLFTAPAYGNTNIGTNTVRQSYYGICHVDVEEDIRGLTGFIAVETYGGYTETMPFEFGAVGGVRWCSTEIASISSAAGTTSVSTMRGTAINANDVYQSYIYGKESVGSVGLGNMHATNAYEMFDPATPPAVKLIIKGLGEVGTDLFNEVSSAAWKAWFAGKVLNTGWIFSIRSLSAKV